jgi:hypothetical protein
MKKLFRFLLLLLVAFAIYAGFVSQVWSYPIGIIAFSFICFFGTLSGKRSVTASNSSSTVVGASVASNISSGSDCGGADGGC